MLGYENARALLDGAQMSTQLTFQISNTNRYHGAHPCTENGTVRAMSAVICVHIIIIWPHRYHVKVGKHGSDNATTVRALS